MGKAAVGSFALMVLVIIVVGAISEQIEKVLDRWRKRRDKSTIFHLLFFGTMRKKER